MFKDIWIIQKTLSSLWIYKTDAKIKIYGLYWSDAIYSLCVYRKPALYTFSYSFLSGKQLTAKPPQDSFCFRVI